MRTHFYDLLLLSYFPPYLSSVSSDRLPWQKPLIELFFLPFSLYFILLVPLTFWSCFLSIYVNVWICTRVRESLRLSRVTPLDSFGDLGQREGGGGGTGPWRKKLNNEKKKEKKKIRIQKSVARSEPAFESTGLWGVVPRVMSYWTWLACRLRLLNLVYIWKLSLSFNLLDSMTSVSILVSHMPLLPSSFIYTC